MLKVLTASGHTRLHPDWESQSVGYLAQVTVIQILVVVDTLMCPRTLSLLPSIWLHSSAWEPMHHAWEGVQLQVEPPGAC